MAQSCTLQFSLQAASPETFGYTFVLLWVCICPTYQRYSERMDPCNRGRLYWRNWTS